MEAKFVDEKPSGLLLLQLRCGCRLWLRLSENEIDRFGRHARWCGRSDSGVYHDYTRTGRGLYAEIGVSLRNALHLRAAENGDPCPNAIRDCEGCTEQSLDAGIPLSVIEGKTKLADHFGEAEIARNSGDHARADEIEREEMIDAGRGNLLR